MQVTLSAGRRKAATGFILVTAMLDIMAMGIVIPVLPVLIEEFSGSNARAGIVNGLFVTLWAGMQFLASPLIGSLSDRYGRRPTILVSAAGLAADYVLMALAPSLWWLALGRLIAGVTSASFTTVYAYMADVTAPEGRARAYGLIGSAFSAGFVAGPLLGGVLAAWYHSEGHLSVQRIASRRAEGFYWMAILVSNTLGTALGDFLADSSGLGFAASAGLIAAVIAATALAYRFTSVSRVLLFWIAFVMTRPFGATFGDLLTKPAAHGGLELGTGGASLVLAVLLVAGLLVQGLGGRALSAPNARSRRGRAGGTGPAGSAR